MDSLKVIRELLDKPKKVVVTTHINPDADALGSSLALTAYLKKKGHEVQVITPSDYPGFLHWMTGQEDTISYSAYTARRANTFIVEADIIFCLDFSSLERINELGAIISRSTAKKILIDHHLQPEKFADVTIWDINAASTAELVYEFIVNQGDKKRIDSDIANNLYAGIMTDTGNFRHPSTTRKVFQICAELVELGADTAMVSRNIYDNNSIDRIRLLGFTLNERLRFLPEYHTAYIFLKQQDLIDFNARTGDTEGFVNYALSLKGVKFAALFSDKGDIVKISFRSVGDFSVNDFAREHFEGGGHKNAAGGRSHLSLEETIVKFEKLLGNYTHQLTTKTITHEQNV
ncbi:MAG: bifunctional oligoribonuclease/PAP phosphatase NrnA [Cyclobacteriaceae bacterium]|nr:bifunctional oligoribonuclease/PAP phosphatase NrnA [Cyclobacteriaceae bacterium]